MLAPQYDVPCSADYEPLSGPFRSVIALFSLVPSVWINFGPTVRRAMFSRLRADEWAFSERYTAIFARPFRLEKCRPRNTTRHVRQITSCRVGFFGALYRYFRSFLLTEKMLAPQYDAPCSADHEPLSDLFRSVVPLFSPHCFIGAFSASP